MGRVGAWIFSEFAPAARDGVSFGYPPRDAALRADEAWGHVYIKKCLNPELLIVHRQKAGNWPQLYSASRIGRNMTQVTSDCVWKQIMSANNPSVKSHKSNFFAQFQSNSFDFLRRVCK
jgi:hypothetical protein